MRPMLRTLLVGALLLMAALGMGELRAEEDAYVWATRDLTAQRWKDAAEPTSGDVKTNDRLQVVFKTEGWYRVRVPKSPRFGWVPADAVTTVKPEGATDGAEASPAMDLDLQKMIQEKLREQGLNPGTGAAE